MAERPGAATEEPSEPAVIPPDPASAPDLGRLDPIGSAVPNPLDPSGELRAAVDDCVHCGFCLPACPTYQLWGEEMDSPRGRIHLIGQLLDGATASQAAAQHIDRCLGCMACLTACPSGVRYDRLIGAARSWASAAAEEQPGIPSASPAARHSGEQAAGHSPRQAAGHSAEQAGRAAEQSADQEAGHPARPGAGRPLEPPRRPLPPRSRRDRLVRAAIFATFPYPDRLRLLAGPLRAVQRTGLDRVLDQTALASRLAPELAAALRVAPRLGAQSPLPRGAAARSEPGGRRSATLRAPIPGRTSRRRNATHRAGRPPERIPARGNRRAVVGMLTGCVQQVFFPQVNVATARVLAAEGCDVVVPAGQGCCGALSMHDGRTAEAARFARSLIETFERAGVDVIVVNSAGCGSAMKEYRELLADDAGWAGRAARLSTKVADFSEFLADIGPSAPRHPLPLTVAYHDACHLAHAQRITRAPRDLLVAIPGLNLAEIPDAGTCCGSAGIYNLVQPQAAADLGERKAAAVRETGADLLVSGNPGCALQIGAALAVLGSPMPVAHLAEVLDASIRSHPVSRLLHSSPG